MRRSWLPMANVSELWNLLSRFAEPWLVFTAFTATAEACSRRPAL